MAESATAMISVGGPITGGLVPNNFEGLWRMAQIMSASGLMPTGIQKPEAVFVAVQMGLEIGLSPMQAVQNIAVVNGRPSLWGDSVLALVRSSGLLDNFTETVKGTFPGDDYAALCVAFRKGDKEPIVREFSVSDAKQAGLWCADTKNEKYMLTPWYKYPKRMLQMRARSWALRDGFGDVLKGLRMAEEERDMIVDMIPTKGDGYVAPTPVAAPDYDTIKSSLTAIVRDELGLDVLADVDRFIGLSAKNLGRSNAEVEVMAIENWASFRAQFETWIKKTGKSVPAPTNEPDPLPPPPAVEPEVFPEGNWWDDDRHWKFRRADAFKDVIRAGFGLSYNLPNDEAARGTLPGASGEIKKAIKNKFLKAFDLDRWAALMSEAGISKQTNGKATVDPEQTAIKEAIEAVKGQLYECQPANVTKAKKDLGYGIAEAPGDLESWQALCTRAIEYDTDTAEPMGYERQPGDDDERF